VYLNTITLCELNINKGTNMPFLNQWIWAVGWWWLFECAPNNRLRYERICFSWDNISN